MKEIEQEIENLVSALAFATLEPVRQRLVSQIEKLHTELAHLQEQEQVYQQREEELLVLPLSPASLRAAQSTKKILETLRAKWDMASIASRQALMQWIIESVTIAPVLEDRKLLRGAITWRGGSITPLEIVRKFDRRQEWDEREKEVMRLWYSKARKEDLLALLPGRTFNGILVAAMRMNIGGSRSRKSWEWVEIPAEEMQRLAPTSSYGLEIAIDQSEICSASSSLDGEVFLDVAKMLRQEEF